MVDLSNAANTAASKTGDVLMKGIDADFNKFIVVFILIFGSLIVLYMLRALVKFIDVKFINTRMKEFKVTATSVMSNNDAHVEALKNLSEKNTTDLKTIQESIRKDFHEQQNGWIKIKGEIYDHVNSVKIDLTKVTAQVDTMAKGLPSVQAALESYQKDVTENLKPRLEKVEGLQQRTFQVLKNFLDENKNKKGGK